MGEAPSPQPPSTAESNAANPFTLDKLDGVVAFINYRDQIFFSWTYRGKQGYNLDQYEQENQISLPQMELKKIGALANAYSTKRFREQFTEAEMDRLLIFLQKLDPELRGGVLPKKQRRVYSDTEIAQAQELALDPKLLWHIRCHMDQTYVGELKTKLVVFLICCSSKLDEPGLSGIGGPQSAIVQGASSVGKSALLRSVLQYFDNVESFTRITMGAADRRAVDLTGMILHVEELKGAEAAQPTIRVMLSEGRLRLLTTNPDTKLVEEINTKGVPTFLTTMTAQKTDEELQTRTWFPSLDESQQQTRRILRFQAMLASNPRWKPIPPNVIAALLNTDVLKHYAVTVPFAFHLQANLPAVLRARRDFPKLLALIQANAWFHQHQRPTIELDGVTWVVATWADYLQAITIADEALAQTITGMESHMIHCIDIIKKREATVSEWTASAMALELGLGQQRTLQVLDALVFYGHLLKNEEHRPYRYTLASQKRLPGFSRIREMLLRPLSFTMNDAQRWLDSIDPRNDLTPEAKLNYAFKIREAAAFDPVAGTSIVTLGTPIATPQSQELEPPGGGLYKPEIPTVDLQEEPQKPPLLVDPFARYVGGQEGASGGGETENP